MLSRLLFKQLPDVLVPKHGGHGDVNANHLCTSYKADIRCENYGKALNGRLYEIEIDVLIVFTVYVHSARNNSGRRRSDCEHSFFHAFAFPVISAV